MRPDGGGGLRIRAPADLLPAIGTPRRLWLVDLSETARLLAAGRP
jgi:hypothetical protein